MTDRQEVGQIQIKTESDSPFPIKALMVPIEVLCAALLLSLIVIVLIGVIFRYFLSSPIYWIDEVAGIAFVWLSMLGSVVAIERGEHLRMMLFFGMLPSHLKPLVSTFSQLAVAAFLGAMLHPSVSFTLLEAGTSMPGLGLPSSIKAAAMPAGIALMLLVVLSKVVHKSELGNILISVVVISAVVLSLWTFKETIIGLGRVNIFIFLVFTTFAFLCLGVPIAFCFGLGTVSFIMFASHVPPSVLVARMEAGMGSMILFAVPVFVLLGCVLDATGMGKAIVNAMSSLFGHMKAGMSYVLLGSLYFVSGISGSKVSDMATVAPALFPEMKRRGNKPPEMVALLATGAIMADTVPPSIVLIVLGSVAGLSIAALFTSGFVVAFYLLVILAIVARWKSRRESTEGVRRASLRTIMRLLLVGLPALVLPVLIRIVVGEGIATANEVSTVAVVYALTIGAAVYGGFSWSRFYSMLIETAAMSGAILLIMGTALATAWALTQTGFAGQLAAFMSQLPGGWIGFMIASILLFIVLGCLLEGLPALVLLAPLMFPIAYSFGINGIHYAMVVVVAMNIGLFIPPIGIGYYVACSIGKVEPTAALGPLWIYMAALIVGVIILAFVPAISIGML